MIYISNRLLGFISILAIIIAGIVYSKGEIYFGSKHPKELTIELGTELPKAKDYVSSADNDASTVKYFIQGMEIDDPNFIGLYDVEIKIQDGRTFKTSLKVQDTNGPVVKASSVKIKYGATYDASAFASSCVDPSGPCKFEFTDTNYGKYKYRGTYTVSVVASDKLGNKTGFSSQLIIE